MDNVTFKQKFDRRAKWLTGLGLLVCVAIFVWLYFRSTASFISAWFALLSVSVILLVWIGMPRLTVLTEYGIRLSCTLKLVTIDNMESVSLKPLASDAFPLLSTLGFMGYVGYYYFKKEKMVAPVMARSLSNLVLVSYESGKRIVIGVPDVGNFLETAESFGCKIVNK